ncbi:aminotransferase class I/II-fold pyridoxal phosphate-dependent enzyme, partial [Microgenomates group bacterium]|nr:aminotransferase class I/II-fold pyridoxal phosphate-dependent enzyme [Microgenomates group bacterium]
MIPLFKPCLGKEEEQAVVATLRSGWLGSGPQVETLEKKLARLTKTKYAIALNSATAALHLSFLTSIQPGDEVITPSLTWVSTVNLIVLSGGAPVFDDVDRDTLMVTPD